MVTLTGASNFAVFFPLQCESTVCQFVTYSPIGPSSAYLKLSAGGAEENGIGVDPLGGTLAKPQSILLFERLHTREHGNSLVTCYTLLVKYMTTPRTNPIGSKAPSHSLYHTMAVKGFV